MPPRLSPIPTKGAFYPASDPSTYHDLLYFEERLKTNAALLNRRKHRYQLFLTQLLFFIIFLLSEIFLQTEFLQTPCHWVLRMVVPAKYRAETGCTEWEIHKYLAVGLLCVAVTTLALFFVSGMYSEKIGYANRYVHHANRSLRNFNMYLNVRQPPLQSKLPFNPLSYLFPRTSPSTPPIESPRLRRRSPSPNRLSKRSSSVPIPTIPPTSNPRGELIFSSRVDKGFREGYERHRAMYQRNKEERERRTYQTTWLGWMHAKIMRLPLSSAANAAPSSSHSGTATPVNSLGRQGSLTGAGTSTAATTGRGRNSSGGTTSSAASTPPSSRRSSPVPHKVLRKGSGTSKNGGTGTPPRQSQLRARLDMESSLNAEAMAAATATPG